jgi:epoxyqueuosine reductase
VASLSAAEIKERARALGFDLCGIAPAAAYPELGRLQGWLDRGFAGDMIYMHKSAAARADIRNLLPSARSVIVTATNYYTPDPPAAAAPRGRIARYAWGDDYHVVLAERLDALLQWMRDRNVAPFDATVFVDKHHVQERVYAHHAGLGWMAKNTCLIHPQLGSWFFLAGIAVSLELAADEPMADQCGACTQCIDACPTGALVGERELDATRCISYLTIELDADIPIEQRRAVDDHIYGCDVCQDVCPWNLAPLATLDPAWQPRGGRNRTPAASLWERSDFELHQAIRGSTMMRTPLSRLRRNLAVVLGNSGEPSAASALDRPGGAIRRAALSAETALVQRHVEWARRQLPAPAVNEPPDSGPTRHRPTRPVDPEGRPQ